MSIWSGLLLELIIVGGVGIGTKYLKVFVFWTGFLKAGPPFLLEVCLVVVE
jgi:hypothetical protein